jgi:hypothetical protein
MRAPTLSRSMVIVVFSFLNELVLCFVLFSVKVYGCRVAAAHEHADSFPRMGPVTPEVSVAKVAAPPGSATIRADFGAWLRLTDKAKLYFYCQRRHLMEFPTLPHYSKFVTATNQVVREAGALLLKNALSSSNAALA